MQKVMADINWSEDRIRKATPKELIELLKTAVGHYREVIRENRFRPNKEEYPHTIFQEIIIDWGKWSNQFNKVVRALTKEHELFVDNGKERHLAKQYATVYLFWNKCHRHLEAYNCLSPLANALTLTRTLGEMEEVEVFFNNLKIEDQEEVPTWLSQSVNQKTEDQE